MIQSWKHKGPERLFERGERRGMRPGLVDRFERILSMMDVAREAHALHLPGIRLHALKGDLHRFRAVTVNANWRIVFRFHDGHAHDVDLVDYH